MSGPGLRAEAGTPPRVLALGVVILDVLAHPVTSLPPVERAHLLEQVRLTAAGTAAGTAVDLARLGADTAVSGLVGADAAGDLVLELLQKANVDVRGLRRDGAAATSVSVLPITPAGDRLAWHFRGANAVFGLEHVDLDRVRASDAVHVGGPDVLSGLGRAAVLEVLTTARAAGALTSMDLLSSVPTMPFAWMQSWAPHLDLVSINRHQAAVVTGADSEEDAAETLRGWGAGWVAITLGARGCLLATAEGRIRVPGFDVPVIDTTGCGDAFSAALLMARLQGRAPAEAALFANAAAALVATGLGSDAGLVDAAQVDEFARDAALARSST